MNVYGVGEVFRTIYNRVYDNLTAIDPYSDAWKLDFRIRNRIGESERIISQRIETLENHIIKQNDATPTLVREISGADESTSSPEAEKLLEKIQNVESEFQVKEKYEEAIDEYVCLATELTRLYNSISKPETDQISSCLQENLSICYANLGDIKKADYYIQKVQQINGFKDRKSALYLSAAVEVYYHKEPKYEDVLKYIDRALEIDQNYRKALLLRALIRVRLRKDAMESILQDIDNAFEGGNEIPSEDWGAYFLHRGVILREAGHLDEAISCYQEALNHGYDDTIVRFNVAVIHYEKAIYQNPYGESIICPTIEFDELLAAYTILKDYVRNLDEKWIRPQSNIDIAMLELFCNICSLLGKKVKDEIPGKLLTLTELSYDTKRVVLLSSREPLTEEEFSQLSNVDGHFARMRDFLNNNQPEKCVEYWKALRTVGFSLTAAIMNLLLQACIELEDYTLYTQERETAVETGVSERLIAVYDAKVAAKKGRIEETCTLFDKIVEKENDYDLLQSAISFYRENGYDEKALAFYRRIAERDENREVFIADPDAFYFEAIAFIKEHDPNLARDICGKLNSEKISELQYCHIRVMTYEKFRNYEEVANACLRALEILESYTDGMNAVVALTALMKFDEAYGIAIKLPDLADNNEERTRAFLVLSDLELLRRNLETSLRWARKAHELNIEEPSHESHQLYASRCLRCNNLDSLEELFQYKQYHPNAV